MQGGYLGFAVAFVVMTAGRSILNLYSAWGASRSIHASSLHKLVGTFVLFFDTTPIGRVLNRFSKVRRLPACCKRWACSYRAAIWCSSRSCADHQDD